VVRLQTKQQQPATVFGGYRAPWVALAAAVRDKYLTVTAGFDPMLRDYKSDAPATRT